MEDVLIKVASMRRLSNHRYPHLPVHALRSRYPDKKAAEALY